MMILIWNISMHITWYTVCIFTVRHKYDLAISVLPGQPEIPA